MSVTTFDDFVDSIPVQLGHQPTETLLMSVVRGTSTINHTLVGYGETPTINLDGARLVFLVALSTSYTFGQQLITDGITIIRKSAHTTHTLPRVSGGWASATDVATAGPDGQLERPRPRELSEFSQKLLLA